MNPRDFQRSAEQFRPAFDWVMREVTMTPAQVPVFFDAVFGAIYGNHRAGGRALLAAWPHAADWPSGRAFLTSDGTPDAEMSMALMLLLLGRFRHVDQRMFRNEQIGELLLHDRTRAKYQHIVVNRREMDEHAHCGRGARVELPLAVGLRQMLEPACAHPACRCTFDPQKSVDAGHELPAEPPDAPLPDDYKARYYQGKAAGVIIVATTLCISCGAWGLHTVYPDAPWHYYFILVVSVLIGFAGHFKKGEAAALDDEKLRLLRQIRDNRA